MNDHILFYAKSPENTLNALYVPMTQEYMTLGTGTPTRMGGATSSTT